MVSDVRLAADEAVGGIDNVRVRRWVYLQDLVQILHFSQDWLPR